MKKIISNALALITVCTFLFSFTPKPGGEGFEIYLNNKVMIQKFGTEINTVQSLSLNNSSPDDKLTIKYHHCGRVGKNRIVTIKDAQNKSLKEFHYADATSSVSSMLVNVKEIISLKKGNNNTLKLLYSSTEIPAGRVLARMNF
jgi:hypothetical protein